MILQRTLQVLGKTTSQIQENGMNDPRPIGHGGCRDYFHLHLHFSCSSASLGCQVHGSSSWKCPLLCHSVAWSPDSSDLFLVFCLLVAFRLPEAQILTKVLHLTNSLPIQCDFPQGFTIIVMVLKCLRNASKPLPTSQKPAYPE